MNQRVSKPLTLRTVVSSMATLRPFRSKSIIAVGPPLRLYSSAMFPDIARRGSRTGGRESANIAARLDVFSYTRARNLKGVNT